MSEPANESGSNGHHSQDSVSEKARRVGHEAVDAAAEKIETLEHRLREETGRLGDKADAARQEAREQFDETLSEIRSFIRKEPVKAAGIAFAAGILATLVLRR